ELLGALRHQPMQDRAPHRKPTAAVWKLRLRRQRRREKTNAAKREGFVHGHMNAEVFQCLKTIRQKTFAARLVDRRLRPVRNDNPKTALPRCDRRSQARGPAANYKNVCRRWNSLAHIRFTTGAAATPNKTPA